MSSASDRRKSSGGDDGAGANWMDTYGDLVTLLLTFFVLLFSFSTIDAQKWQAMVGSFTGISAVGIDPISPEVAVQNPIQPIGPPSMVSNVQEDESSSQAEIDMANLLAMYGIMMDFIANNDIEAQVILEEDDYRIRTIIDEKVLFNTADATVLETAYPVLDNVVAMFKQVEHLFSALIVEGHADNRPINTPQYPSNWHISAYRAVNVLGYILEVGELDPGALTAAGYGDEHPIAPNDSEENMALNRRVEFVVEAVGRRDSGD